MIRAGQISGVFDVVAMDRHPGDPGVTLQEAPYSILLMLTCLVSISLTSPTHSLISYISFEIPPKIPNTPSSGIIEERPQEKSAS